MKKLIFASLFGFFSLGLFAQTPLEEAVDFTAKDVHGNVIHLFDILDNQQQYVLIDFFSVTCGPCQTLAPKMDSVYRYFGYNEMDLYIVAIDQTFDNEMVLGFESEYNTHYPAISGTDGGGGAIYESFQIPYYPSLVLIAPDHSIVEQAIPVPESSRELIELLESYNLQVSSVSELQNESAFSLFPNPATNYFYLQPPLGQQVESISVYSITGSEVLRVHSFTDPQNIKVDIAHLKKGMYLISAQYKDGIRFSNRFVKE
jgi:thiol-disulfide isomerase/thioredoxin